MFKSKDKPKLESDISISKTLSKYSEVLVFFVLELFAFLGFSFANSFILYALISVILFIFAILFSYDSLKKEKEDGLFFLIFLIPFFLFILLTVCSRFSLNQIDAFTNVLTFVGLLCFVGLGYLSKYIEKFNLKYVFLVIYGALFLLVLISFIYSMVCYIPFYTWIYEGKYIYYDGERSTIYDTIKFLMGFEFNDVSIQHFQLYGTMLFSSVIGLKYISFKKEKKLFIAYLCFAILGLVSILFTINKVNLITFILAIGVIIFLIFVKKNYLALRISIYVILGMLGVLFIIFFLNAQSSWDFVKGLQNLISSNFILDKLFNNNRLSIVYKQALDGLLSFEKIFGDSRNIYEIVPTGSWLFDTMITSGLFGAISFICFVVFSIISIVRYNKISKDSELTKSLINSFVMMFFVYSLFAFDMQPYSHYLNIIPMVQNPMFLIVVFLIGYTFTSKKKLKESLLKQDSVVVDAIVKEGVKETNEK